MTDETVDPPEPMSEDALPVDPTAARVSFENLNETEFEEFCYDLLIEQGFVNVDWRKGTRRTPAHRTAESRQRRV